MVNKIGTSATSEGRSFCVVSVVSRFAFVRFLTPFLIAGD